MASAKTLLESETVNYCNIYYDFPKNITIESSKRNTFEGLIFILFGMSMPTCGNILNEPLLWLFLPYFVILGMIKFMNYTKIVICRTTDCIYVYRRNIFGILENRKIRFHQIISPILVNLLEEPLLSRGWITFNPFQLQIFYEFENQICELNLLSGNDLRQMKRIFKEHFELLFK
ncbi:hypothetical protein ACFL35_17630, partial [Candidatus Riflebacteria bacterium]